MLPFGCITPSIKSTDARMSRSADLSDVRNPGTESSIWRIDEIPWPAPGAYSNDWMNGTQTESFPTFMPKRRCFLMPEAATNPTKFITQYIHVKCDKEKHFFKEVLKLKEEDWDSKKHMALWSGSRRQGKGIQLEKSAQGQNAWRNHVGGLWPRSSSNEGFDWLIDAEHSAKPIW